LFGFRCLNSRFAFFFLCFQSILLSTIKIFNFINHFPTCFSFLGFIQRQAMQFFNAVQLVAAGPPRDADLCACVLLVLAAAASPMLGGEEVERLRQHFRQTWEAHAQVPAPRAHFEIAVARTVNLAFLTPRGTFGQPVYNHGLP